MTHTEILANLEEIENVARMACEEANKARKDIPGAINWGDFGVTDVEYAVSSLNGERFVVYIEEAADYNGPLREFLRQFFLDRGYKTPPEFRFEW